MLSLWSTFVASALAGTVLVEPVAGTRAPFVAREGQVVGPIPVDLDLPAGPITLGFLAERFGAVTFEQVVQVPTSGAIRLLVDLDRRAAQVVPVDERTSDSDPPRMADPTGDLFVSASVDGASIFVDGVDTGLVTPNLIQGLQLGDHELSVRTECMRVSSTLVIQADRITRLDGLALAPGPARLRVASRPGGAVVYVDGVERGPTPFEDLTATCGEHALEVRAPGYLSQRTTLRVPAFEVTTWTVDLVQETYGVLTVAVSPLNAIVHIDGVALDAGPQTLDPVATGPHEVRVAAPGFVERTQAVEIHADAVTKLEVTLQSLPPRRRISGRLALNIASAAIGTSAVAWGIAEFSGAQRAYQRYLAEPSDDAAMQLFEEEVRPRRARAYAGWAGGGVALLGSGLLWATTDLSQPKLGVSWRW